MGSVGRLVPKKQGEASRCKAAQVLSKEAVCAWWLSPFWGSFGQADALGKFIGEDAIGTTGGGTWIKVIDGLADELGACNSRGIADLGIKEFVAVLLAQALDDATVEHHVAAVEASADDAEPLEVGVQHLAYGLCGFEDGGDTIEAKDAHITGDKDIISRDKSVERKRSGVGRAIDQDQVVVSASDLTILLEQKFFADARGHLCFGFVEAAVAGDGRKMLDGGGLGQFFDVAVFL